MLSPEALSEFIKIMLKDYGWVSSDNKEILQLANDYLTALEAVVSIPELTKHPERRKHGT